MEYPEAIPLITFDGSFKVDPQAITYLDSFKTKIGIIAVCGKYWTGKSYILNKLFNKS